MYLDTDKAKEAVRRNVLLVTEAYGNGNPRSKGQLVFLQESLLEAMTGCILQEPEVSLESKIFALDLASSVVVFIAPRWAETHVNGVEELVKEFCRIYEGRLNLARKFDGSFQKDIKLFSEQTTSKEDIEKGGTVTVAPTRSSSCKP